MIDLMTFKAGQTLRPLPSRKGSWMPDEIEIVEVKDHGRVIPGVSHRYSVKAANGHWYSGWWFDPDAEAVWDDCDPY